MSLLDGAEPPDELLSLVTARADGNPFFVEELVNTLVDDGVLAREGDTWVLTTRLEELTIPPTIRGLLAARIDNLAPEPRRVLREASVVGREFLYRIMQSVTGAPDDLEVSLAGLSAADLIRERNNDADLEYIFKHALTQEVAYDGLLRRDRQLLHERVARGVEAQLGDRTGEFVETLAYHYQRSGHVVEAVDYLRRSGRKALDRYALAEAHRQYRAAYDLLTADDDDTSAVDRVTRDRLLIETILEWAQCHYYTCDLAGLRDLQERHRDLPAAVGNDVLTARWTAWVGMVTWQEGRISDADRLLTEALDLGRRCDDATAQAYALTWLTWVATAAGDTARAVEIWPALARLVPEVADPHDRQYVQIKGLCGVGQASARRGDTTSATAYADELLDIGRRTGNRRAAAMGHMVLVVVGNVRGDEYSAKAATRAAIDCDADPMYMVFAEAWAAGLAIGSSSPEEARRCFEQVDARVRSLGGGSAVQGPLVVFGYALDVQEGHPSRGMAGLTEERQRQEVLGNREVVHTIDGFTANMRSRLATDYVAGLASPAAIRDRAFLSRQRVGAAKKARGALEELAKSLDECGNNGDRASVEFELAKIAKHDRRNDDARAHLQTVQQLLADSPDASLCLRARGMLAELG
jgi:tetratricopeptide (TPR) repeat protein